jgi:tetratricopeptide (TPR) repeat protein
MSTPGGRPRPRRPGPDLARLFTLITAILAFGGWSFFDPFHKHVEKGNEEAESEEPTGALPHYDEATRIDPGSPVPDFNRGIVLSRDGQGEAARDAFLGAAASEDPQIAADALYNLGNVLMEGQEFQPAVETYLKSLDLDPDDEDARRNLEIAFQRMEEQQQQPQEQEDEQQEQDESGDGEQQQPPDEEESEDPSQDEQPQEDQEPKPQPEEVPPEERLTREQAERLLNAIQSDELKVLQQLQEAEKEERGVATNDW